MTALAEKQGELWCHILAIFSESPQNQVFMASKRYPTQVLSCMHLNIMSKHKLFQQYGWTVLANTVTLPTPRGGKVSKSAASSNACFMRIFNSLCLVNLHVLWHYL